MLALALLLALALALALVPALALTLVLALALALLLAHFLPLQPFVRAPTIMSERPTFEWPSHNKRRKTSARSAAPSIRQAIPQLQLAPRQGQ